MNGYLVAPLESFLRRPIYLVSATQNVASANYWLRGTIWRPGLAPHVGVAGVWEASFCIVIVAKASVRMALLPVGLCFVFEQWL